MSVNADAAIKFARRCISWNQLLKSWVRSLIPETENKQLCQPPGKTNNLIVLLILPNNSYGKNVGQTVLYILDWKPVKEKENSEFKIMNGIHSSPAPRSALDKNTKTWLVGHSMPHRNNIFLKRNIDTQAEQANRSRTQNYQC